MKAFRLDRQEMSPFFSYICTVKLNVCVFVCGIARYIIIAPDGYAQGLAGEKVDLSRGTTALYVCDVDAYLPGIPTCNTFQLDHRSWKQLGQSMDRIGGQYVVRLHSGLCGKDASGLSQSELQLKYLCRG